MNHEPGRVVLIDSSSAGMTVHLSAHVSGDGLTLEGHDIGPRVEELWGDSDYEYWLTIGTADLDRTAELLQDSIAGREDCPGVLGLNLLGLLQQAYRCGMFKGVSDFRSWLADHGITSSFQSWV